MSAYLIDRAQREIESARRVADLEDAASAGFVSRGALVLPNEARENDSAANIVAGAMLYAVAVSDAGYELTVFEEGRSCSVVLDAAMVQQLIDLLTRPSR